MARLSTADKELVDQLLHDTFIKVRQFEAKKKSLTDSMKTAFTKLANDTGISKEQFMEGYKRAQQEEGQLNLFDKGASRSEDVIREILAEVVKAADVDKEEEHEKAETKAAKPKKAAKKAAGKKAAAKKEEPESKPAPANGNGNGRRQSARSQAQTGFVDRNERMSAAQLLAAQAANKEPS